MNGMKYLFPGMDPYLEHPILWESFHARFIPALANQLQPQLDPRYVATVEERVFVEGPQQRIPDVWVQKVPNVLDRRTSAIALADTPTVLEVEELEVHQKRVEILDSYNDLKLVAIIEVISPTNKRAGPGKESFLAKQKEILKKDCHLIEIDLHRQGTHVLSVPEWRLDEVRPYHYLACVNRWPFRNRFVVYHPHLRQRLPRILVPLAEPDPDVTLDIQAAVEQVYQEGRYGRRVRYHEACVPPLSAEDQGWADEIIRDGREEGTGAP